MDDELIEEQRTRKVTAAGEHVPERSTGVALSTQASTGRPPAPVRILVVDDKQRVTQLLGILLEEAGYVVVSETDAREALELTRSQSFDLVLCDIVMPAMSGYDFCQRLRSHAGTARVPLLFVSSREEREGALTGGIVGADGYVEKPFDREVLLARVKELLSRGVERG